MDDPNMHAYGEAGPDDAEIGRQWRENSSLAKWFPLTAERLAALEPYQVDDRLMDLAAGNGVFLHCLPAHRGEEVTDAVIDGPQSVIWDEAENRLHAQKSILRWCFGQI